MTEGTGFSIHHDWNWIVRDDATAFTENKKRTANRAF